MMRTSAIAICYLLSPSPAATNNYPTEARVEYVLACLSHAGDGAAEKSTLLRRCACAIDTVAAHLPYDGYVAAETVLRMRKMNGEKGSLFRESPTLDETVKTLRRAEAAAKKVCF